MPIPSRLAFAHHCYTISNRDVFIYKVCSTGLQGVTPLVLVHVWWGKNQKNVPSCQSSTPGRVRFKPSVEAHHSHLCTIKPPPAVHAPHVLTNFAKQWVYRRLTLICKPLTENPCRAGPWTWCSKRSRGLRGFFQYDSVHTPYLNGLCSVNMCLHTPAYSLINGPRNVCCNSHKKQFYVS